MERKMYAAFNPADFSLLASFTKEERIQAKLVFNYTSQLASSESREIPTRSQGEPSITKGTTPPPNSPIKDLGGEGTSGKGKKPVTEEAPPPPQFQIHVPSVQPPAPRTFLISRIVLQQCRDINNLPDEEKPGYEPQPSLDPSMVEETPFELIADHPEWRRQYMRDILVLNRYYDTPTCI